MVRGALTKTERSALQIRLSDVYARFVGHQGKVAVIWVELPKGQAFQARQPSSTSTLLVPVPEGFEQGKRVSMMEAVRDMWMQTTGCAANQLVISIADRSWFEKYVTLSRNRIAPNKRRLMGAKILWRLFSSRLRTGMLSMSANMDGSK